MAGKKKHGKKISEEEQQRIAEEREMEASRLARVSDLLYTARTAVEQAGNVVVEFESPDMNKVWEELYDLQQVVEAVHARIIVAKFVRE